MKQDQHQAIDMRINQMVRVNETSHDGELCWKGRIVSLCGGYARVENLMRHGPDYGLVVSVPKERLRAWNPKDEVNV